MASEFKIKNGLIVVGDVSTSGTITINGALAATQSWVTSQAYLTSSSLTSYATQSYVTSAIASLVDSAPGTLDTLRELATALGNDASFSTTITNSISSKQSQLNGTGLVRMSGTSVSYDNTTYLISNFGNIEGDHTYGYPSSNGWYKIAEVVFNGACQSYNLWGEYRDTGYFDNSHYRIHITARAECDFPTNNESHAINVNIYGSSTNETYFSNNVRVVLTSSSSNYRKYELQYYRETWDTGSWNLQNIGWTTYTTSQTAGTPTGTARVYYISKFSTDNIFVANKISIGTTYAGFAANIAGTTYIIGGDLFLSDGYTVRNASNNSSIAFNTSALSFTGAATFSSTISSGGNINVGGQLTFTPNEARIISGSSTFAINNNANNTNLLLINNSTGNVGIGTSSPGYKLDVQGSAGNITINTNGLLSAGGQIISGTGEFASSSSGTDLNFRAGATHLMVLKTSGNVGIGTTTPQKKLDVFGSAGIVASFGASISPGEFAGLHFGYSESYINNDSYKKSALVFERTDNNNQGGNASGKIHFLLNNYGSSSATSLTQSVVTIDSDASATVGSVRMGIGTRNPIFNLQVGENAGTIATTTIRLQNSYLDNGNYGFNIDAVDNGVNGHDLRFFGRTSPTSSFSELVRIKNSGNVGIGTNSPTEKIDVDGNIRIRGNRGVYFDTTGAVASNYITVTNDYWTTIHCARGNTSTINLTNGNGITFFESSIERMRIAAGGNVGIGTTSPANKLVVTSDASPTNENTYAIAAASASDPAYKTIIGYDYTNDIGLIAAVRTGIGWRNLSIPQGSLGIGTYSPSYKLDVNGETRLGKLITTWSNSPISPSAVMYSESGYNTVFAGNGQFSTSYLALMTTGNMSYMGGNIGIGTVTPATSLEVQGAASTQIQAIFQSASSGNAAYNGGIQLGNAASNQKSTIVHDSSGDNTLTFTSHYSSGSANKFIFAPGGTERVRFQQNGNVGIGTTDPTSQMSGTFGIGIYNASYPAVGFKNSTTAWLWYGQNSTFKMWNVTAGDILTANTSGNIGIGTTSPSTKLDVNGVISATGGNSTNWNTAYGWGNHASADYIVKGTQILSSASWPTATRFGSVGSISQDAGNHALSVRSELGNDAFMSFHIGSDYAVHFGLDGVSNRMSVGGWSDGAVKYQLWDTRDFTSTNVSNWNTAYSWGNHASASYATTSYVTTQINNLINGAPGVLDTLDELAAALGDDSNFATTVTNSIAGKVSKAGDTMTGNINWDTQNTGLTWNMNTDGAYIKFFNTGDGDTNSRLEYSTSDNGDEFHRWVIAGVEKMNLKWGGLTVTDTIYASGGNSGNWNTAYGWGNHASAGYALNSSLANYLPLSGGVIGGGVTINGNLTVNGTITENSSIKLKENIETSEGNLEKVVNLRPVTYNKIGSQTTELGLIAEEVAEVYPEFVQYDENGEPIGVHYSRLTAALIGAVKELTNQVQELNKKING
jgi:hypothetical protein